MSLETILILSTIINIVILICFFGLCSNVSSIKKSISHSNSWNEEFVFYYSVGQIEDAKKILLKAITKDEFFLIAFYSYLDNKKYAQEQIEKRYKKYLDLVDVKIDFNKVDDFLSKLN